MDQMTFIDKLCAAASADVSLELIENWRNPPGRLRSEERSGRSAWVSGMKHEEAQLLAAFGSEAARSVMFGILAVLDGARKIEQGTGHLELRYINGEEAVLLSSSAPDMPVPLLHELLP